MHKKIRLAYSSKLVWLLLFPVSLFAQTPSKEVQERINKVENFLSPGTVYGDTIPRGNIEMRMKDTKTKGLSIAVIHNYQVEWAKGYGWADEGEQKKVTTTTRFQAASISKSLNSMGILKLVEQGKLDPEADINNYLATWKFPYDSLSGNKKISTYNLLSHTAGLGIHGFPGYVANAKLPSVTEVLDGKKPANTKAVRSQYEPGKQFEYSGGGTTISQLLLTTITGQDYAKYMQTEVLTPLGMTNSSYQQPPPAEAELATGYYNDGKPVKMKYHIYPEQAAAGLWTTPTDLAKYVIECQLAYEGRSKKVLSPVMMKRRLTPYIDTFAAMGVFIDNRNGHKYFIHNGGNEAFVCLYYGSLEGGNGVVIMENGENFGLITEVLNSVAQVYNWKDFYNPVFKRVVTVPKDTLSQYNGKYLMGKDTLTLKFVDNDLVLQQNGEPADGYKLIFSHNASFYILEEPSAVFKVLRNATGKVDALELKQSGTITRLPRME
ncbi:MAG TPA: serine hydrolase domain-containing protein [Chitinophagaceae bacterium]|jgi:CubicO group peptidase (beta-lactamase class C family)|nr:serine hydrolase domain-containing protein [Chitinophagaceae bacterium]